MSTLAVNNITSKSGAPVNFPNGLSIGAGASFGNINNIGVMGQQGAGVGICPAIPSGMEKLYGTDDIASDNYGNYKWAADNSIMLWIPAHFYKEGTGANGLAVNRVDIKPFNYFASVAAANAAGYALDRSFYNAGKVKPGIFRDKYFNSNNAGVSSSIKMGNPLTPYATHNPFSGLTGAPANIFGSVFAVAKTRGTAFFPALDFIGVMLARLARAHGQAAISTASCAWFDPNGIKNYPKGCDNNALGSYDDADLSFVSDGFPNCAKAGSANFFARTTHNGQNSGGEICGNVWQIQPGMTSDGTDIFLLKTSVDVATITGGNTLATDAWGAVGLAAMYDNIGPTYGALLGTSTQKVLGSASQVFSEATSGIAWNAAAHGIPLLGGIGGSNVFGNDGFYDYKPNEMCPMGGGDWSGASLSGAGARYLGSVRSSSGPYYGLFSALHLNP